MEAEMLRKMVLVIISLSALVQKIEASEFNLDNWKQLRSGMSEADVVRTLGPPDDQFREGLRVLVYGTIVPKGETFPRPLGYWVWLDNNNMVRSFEAPFGREAPRLGEPSVPIIFLPTNNARFSFYPRTLDIRWHPVTGTYPVSYEVQYESGDRTATGTQWVPTDSFVTSIPYIAIQHRGGQPGRIRVRSKNARGMSPWSEFVVFEFSQ
jgi:hypothetical protein